MNKFLLATPLLLLLGACNTTQTNVQVKPLDLSVAAPVPQAINMRPIEFKVFTKSDIEKLSKEDKDYAFYVLTPKGYENLMLNLGELRRYIEEQQQVIVYYKKITTGAS